MEICEQLGTSVSGLEAGKASPAVLDAGSPPGRVGKKMVPPMTIQKMVEETPVALDVGVPPCPGKASELAAMPVANPNAGKASPATVDGESSLRRYVRRGGPCDHPEGGRGDHGSG